MDLQYTLESYARQLQNKPRKGHSVLKKYRVLRLLFSSRRG